MCFTRFRWKTNMLWGRFRMSAIRQFLRNWLFGILILWIWKLCRFVRNEVPWFYKFVTNIVTFLKICRRAEEVYHNSLFESAGLFGFWFSRDCCLPCFGVPSRWQMKWLNKGLGGSNYHNGRHTNRFFTRTCGEAKSEKWSVLLLTAAAWINN